MMALMNDAALARLRALAGIDAPGVWVVGGAVRDVLLGREPHEADLVLEGDAVELARTLGHVAAVHERFGTATVLVDGRSVDLASARLESYARPGALPDVEPAATIEEDLLRRDFTVNAIAVRLADGEERAVEHAHEDLRARVLRVLSIDPGRQKCGVAVVDGGAGLARPS